MRHIVDYRGRIKKNRPVTGCRTPQIKSVSCKSGERDAIYKAPGAQAQSRRTGHIACTRSSCSVTR